MEKFIALKQAEDLEHNLKQIIRATRGESGLRQFMALRQEEKKVVEREAYEIRKRKAFIRECLTIGVGVIVFVVGMGGLVYVAWLFSEGKL